MYTPRSYKTYGIQISEYEWEYTDECLHEEANDLAQEYLSISGMDALCMVARGDFYDTDLEGSILHTRFRQIAFLLGWI